MIKPRIGEHIYDGAVGSVGFLCESHDYLRQGKLTTSQLKMELIYLKATNTSSTFMLLSLLLDTIPLLYYQT